MGTAPSGRVGVREILEEADVPAFTRDSNGAGPLHIAPIGPAAAAAATAPAPVAAAPAGAAASVELAPAHVLDGGSAASEVTETTLAAAVDAAPPRAPKRGDKERPRRDRERGERGERDRSERSSLGGRDGGGPPTPAIPLEQIDRDAIEVVRRLRRFGHKAYLVGGCVRDLFLGHKPKDFDVATSARPEEIRAVFRNCRIIGRRFRLAHVYFRGGKIIETSTFRANAAPPPGIPEDETEVAATEPDLLIRHDNVFGTEEEDARRRDFTINGLFYDVATGRIIDHVGGLEDLATRTVRMIGNPEIRLREDPVRILRAARIAAKLDLEIDPELLAAMRRYKHDIARCARARVFEETLRLFRAGHGAKSVNVLDQVGVLDEVLPEVAAYLERARIDGHPERSELLFRCLLALDERVARGAVSDSVMLGALLLAPILTIQENLEAEAAAAAGGEGGARRHGADKARAAIEGYLIEMTTRLGATRRTSERLRQIFLAQRHLIPPPNSRARRRVSVQALAKRSYFAESLDLFEIQTIATGGSLDGVRAWREQTGDEPVDEGPWQPSEPPPAPVRSGRRPRRRRRGGERRGAAASPTSAPPPPRQTTSKPPTE